MTPLLGTQGACWELRGAQRPSWDWLCQAGQSRLPAQGTSLSWGGGLGTPGAGTVHG